MTCTFCGRPDYCGSTISPRMCEQHFSLVLIGLKLARRGQFVTNGAVILALRALTPDQRALVLVQEWEVRDLMDQLARGGYQWPKFGRNGTNRHMVIGGQE